MAPPTKVFPASAKSYYLDHQHQVYPESELRQITQYECDLSDRHVVTCVPLDRFFRVARGGGVVEVTRSEAFSQQQRLTQRQVEQGGKNEQ